MGEKGRSKVDDCKRGGGEVMPRCRATIAATCDAIAVDNNFTVSSYSIRSVLSNSTNKVILSDVRQSRSTCHPLLLSIAADLRYDNISDPFVPTSNDSEVPKSMCQMPQQIILRKNILHLYSDPGGEIHLRTDYLSTRAGPRNYSASC